MVLSKISNFINKGHERSIKARKNILFSFIIKGFSVFVNLLLVRIAIDFISAQDYGVWITLSSIVAWFSFFDIGFGHGLRNKFAEAVAKGDEKLARIYVSTTYAAVSIVIVIVWVVFLVINHFLNWSAILNVASLKERELEQVALLVFSFFC